MENISSQPESEISEWKASWRDEYLKWLTAYAHTDGGKLYIGVNDDGYIVGLKDYRKLLEDLPNIIKNKLLITPFVRLRWTNVRGTNIRYDNVPDEISSKDISKYICGTFTPRNSSDEKKLEIWEKEVPVTRDHDGRYYYIEIEVDHYSNLITYNGVAYTRIGSTLQVLEGKELEKAVLRSSGKTWDDFEAGSKTISDLDHEALNAFRRKSVDNKRLTAEQAAVSDEILIENLNLVTDEGRLTRAAAMLFSDPEKVAVGSYIKIGYFAPDGAYGENTGNDVIYHDLIRGPLITQADKAIDCLYSKYMKALISYKGIQRVESYMIPQNAMREIILNAIAHKYYPSGNPIQIKVYDDHITIMNEGFWPFEYINVNEAYTGEHGSYPENPHIAEGLYMAGDIETWGSGFEKIRKACEQYGAPLPEISVTKGSITVLVKPADSYMAVLNQMKKSAIKATESTEVSADSGKEIGDKKSAIKIGDKKSAIKKDDSISKITTERCSSILSYMEPEREYSLSEIATAINLSVSRTRDYLRLLSDRKVIITTGANRNKKYLKPS